MSNSRNPIAQVDPRADDADALNAWARHALAANGFGDADAALASRPERPSAGAQRVVRAHRAYRLSEIAVALGTSLGATCAPRCTH